MYSAHVTEVANPKEDLLNGLEFCDWKEQLKTDFTFPYYKDGVTTSPELLKYLLAIIKGRTDNVFVRE